MRTFKLFILFFLLPGLTSAQLSDNPISGKVLSASTNQPVSGVEVEIIHSNEKTYSTEDGRYQIPFTGEEIWINFSYPGFTPRLILFNKSGEQNIYLTETEFKSTDSKVPGFFGDIIKYKNASYDYFTRNEIKSSTMANPELAIQGKMAGLNIEAISGMPGEGGNISIRAISSLFAHKNPLVIVDGVPVNPNLYESGIAEGVFYNPLNSIDVNDIAKIEVFRDGSSLYGMQGGNGIIMITTHQPASVSTKINFSAFTGITTKPEYIKMLSAPEHKTYLIQQFQSSGVPFSENLRENPWISGNPVYFDYYNYDNNTNWQNEVFRMAHVNKFNAGLEGGDEIARFAVSLGYLDQQGIINNTGFQRYNFRFNSVVKILERLTMSANIGFAYNNSELKNFGVDQGLNPITSALLKPPMFAPYLRNSRGERIPLLGDADKYGFSNPVAIAEKTDVNSFESNLLANVKLNYLLGYGFNFSSIFGLSFDNTKENVFVPDYGIVDFNMGEVKNFATEGIFKTSGFFNETKFDYINRLNYTHYFTAQGGIRTQTAKEIYNKGSVFNTPTDEFKSLSSVTSITQTLLDGFNKVENRSDLFLTGGYRFKDRYLLDLVLTLSGTSNAGEEADAINFLGGKWGFFPSILAGWLISSEAFMQDVQAISLLKLRTSYTISGNDFFSDYFRYGYTSRPYGKNSGIVRTYIPNKSLKWEEINQLNLGLDAGLFNDRLMFSIDLYNRKTNDLLTFRETPVTAGFEYFWQNSGSLTTKGMDASAWIRLLTGSLNLSLGGNISLHHSKLSIPDNIILDVPGGQVIIENGSNPFSFYGLMTNGIYQTEQEAISSGLVNSSGIPFQAGDVRFINLDNNNLINDADKSSIGNMFPKMTGGFSLNLSYKFLSLNIMSDYSRGNKIFNYTRMLTESFSGYNNQTLAARYAWKSEVDITDIPRIDFNDQAGNSAFSQRWIEDGSFIRLKEITLSFSLPATGFYDNLTLYLTGQNLLTSTKYLGYYPEFSYSSNPAMQGIDYGQIPITPVFLTGFKIGF